MKPIPVSAPSPSGQSVGGLWCCGSGNTRTLLPNEALEKQDAKSSMGEQLGECCHCFHYDFEDEDKHWCVCGCGYVVALACFALQLVVVIIWLSKHPHQREYSFWEIVWVEVILGCITLFWFCFNFWLGWLVKQAVQRLDRRVLGVDVEVKRIIPFLCRGVLHVRGLTVRNPEGYAAPYLLKAEKIAMDIQMQKLFGSCFKNVVIQHLVIQDVDLVLQKGWTSSNVGDMLAYLQRKKPPAEQPVKQSEAQEDHSSTTAMSLRRVNIENVKGRAFLNFSGSYGPEIKLGDVNYNNLADETGARVASEVCKVILMAVLSNLQLNISAF